MAFLSAELEGEFWSLLGKLDGAAVVVEGRKDKAALESLGVDGSRIVALNKTALFAVAESVASEYGAAIILTDLDGEGKKLYGRLNTMLQDLGVKVNNDLRNFLFRKTKIRQVEGLAALRRP